MVRFYLFISILLSLLSIEAEAQNCQSYFISSNNSGNAVQFIDSSMSASGNLSYFWTFGNGDSSSLSNPIYTYPQSGNYVVCLRVLSSMGCQDTYCDTISVGNVNPPCSVSYSYFIDSTNTAYFTSNSNAAGPRTYQWTFGDGNSSSLANPNHQYNSPGSYRVGLTVVSPNGSTCNFYDTVYVNFCAPFFIHTANTNGFVSFSNYSNTSRSSSYRWDFGDGSLFSFLENPTHTYLNSGIFVATLTTFDSLSNCTNSFSDSISINILPSCQAGFTYQMNQGNVSFQSTASNFSSILYDFGNGNSSTQANPNHFYTQSGTYIVCQTVGDSLTNCTSTFCDSITVSLVPPCQAGFTYSKSQGSISITNTAANFNQVNYDFGDGGTSTATNPNYTYLQSGTYLVCQTISNNSGCIDTFCDSINIVLTPPCMALFAFSTNEDTLSILDLSSNADSIFYDYGDGSSSANNSHIYAQSGTYLICQTVYGANGCSDTFCDTVQILIPPCKAGFSYAQSGDSIFFNNLASNYTSISYDFGDNSSSSNQNPKHLYINSGNYIVKQTVINVARGCVDSFSDTISVNISTSCVAKFLIAIDTNNTGTLFIVNTSSNDNTHQYAWSFGDGNFGSGRLPTHFYQDNKAHEICLTITDSAMNCTSTFCDTVGLDSNGNILKASGYSLKVLEGDFIGIEENQNELESIGIYPNPFTHELNLEFDGINSLQFELLNLTGNIIKKGSVVDFKVLLPDIDNGIYFIRLTDGENTMVKKVIKQNF